MAVRLLFPLGEDFLPRHEEDLLALLFGVLFNGSY